MAKSIGNVGVTVSANTLGFKKGMDAAAASTARFRNSVVATRQATVQFSATARVAGAIAGQFDNAFVRMGTDVATFSAVTRNAIPGVTARLAGLGGILVGLIANFKEIKAAAISAAVSVTDFFTKNKDVSKNFQGQLVAPSAKTMGAAIQKQIAGLRIETDFISGSIGLGERLFRQHRNEGAGFFESQQLTAAELGKEIAERQAELEKPDKGGFSISSGRFFGGAPTGQVIGIQRESEKTNDILEEIRKLQEQQTDILKKGTPGVTVGP